MFNTRTAKPNWLYSDLHEADVGSESLMRPGEQSFMGIPRFSSGFICVSSPRHRTTQVAGNLAHSGSYDCLDCDIRLTHDRTNHSRNHDHGLDTIWPSPTHQGSAVTIGGFY